MSAPGSDEVTVTTVSIIAVCVSITRMGEGMVGPSMTPTRANAGEGDSADRRGGPSTRSLSSRGSTFMLPVRISAMPVIESYTSPTAGNCLVRKSRSFTRSVPSTTNS